MEKAQLVTGAPPAAALLTDSWSKQTQSKLVTTGVIMEANRANYPSIRSGIVIWVHENKEGSPQVVQKQFPKLRFHCLGDLKSHERRRKRSNAYISTHVREERAVIAHSTKQNSKLPTL